ncbi:DUF2059 domain-containing protein [Altererythrobacter sp.]|uniref:DUF2059 domain-containing protein n=1 Tax=Altererythrobacter sp. TaxID=1872480 RepID=UPI003CFBD9D6
MIRKTIFSLGVGLALLAQPVAAQSDQSGAQAAAAMQELFKADPLTGEQEARLPAAKAVVGKIFPAGTYMKMMNDTMRPVMDSVMGQVSQMPPKSLIAMAGLPQEKVDSLGDGTLSELMQIMDPAYGQRQKIASGVMIDWMTRLMDQMEPSVRAGLTRAYAVRFSQSELSDLNAYFATPTGSKYASESMLIMTDRQVLAAMGEMMPAMMEMMPEMAKAMQERMAELPPPRETKDLSDEERARISELLGISPDRLGADD